MKTDTNHMERKHNCLSLLELQDSSVVIRLISQRVFSLQEFCIFPAWMNFPAGVFVNFLRKKICYEFLASWPSKSCIIFASKWVTGFVLTLPSTDDGTLDCWLVRLLSTCYENTLSELELGTRCLTVLTCGITVKALKIRAQVEDRDSEL